MGAGRLVGAQVISEIGDEIHAARHARRLTWPTTHYSIVRGLIGETRRLNIGSNGNRRTLAERLRSVTV
jgi:hypothetical protein